MGEREKILIADDDIGVRQSLRRFLEQKGHEVVSEAGSVLGVIAQITAGAQFSLAIIDGDMPYKGDGAKAAEHIRSQRPEAKIISLSREQQKFGDANLLKSDGPVVLINTIREI